MFFYFVLSGVIMLFVNVNSYQYNTVIMYDKVFSFFLSMLQLFNVANCIFNSRVMDSLYHTWNWVALNVLFMRFTGLVCKPET